MSLALLLALQAPPAPAEPLPIDFDLARVRPAEACGAEGGGSEIVVCGRRPGGGDYPIEKWERVFRTKPLVAEKSMMAKLTSGNFLATSPTDLPIRKPFPMIRS